MVASMGWKWVVGGRRRSQWSSGEFMGVNVGVCGSPMWVSDVVWHSSCSWAQKDLLGFGVGFLGGRPLGVLGGVGNLL